MATQSQADRARKSAAFQRCVSELSKYPEFSGDGTDEIESGVMLVLYFKDARKLSTEIIRLIPDRIDLTSKVSVPVGLCSVRNLAPNA